MTYLRSDDLHIIRLCEEGHMPPWHDGVCACVQGMLDTILEVSFTADQKHLLAAGGDQALRMWDIASGRVRHTLTGHTGKVLPTMTKPLHGIFV